MREYARAQDIVYVVPQSVRFAGGRCMFSLGLVTRRAALLYDMRYMMQPLLRWQFAHAEPVAAARFVCLSPAVRLALRCIRCLKRNAHCQITAELLPNYCLITVGLLPNYCRITAELLPKLRPTRSVVHSGRPNRKTV